jgi:hypothetical protein
VLAGAAIQLAFIASGSPNAMNMAWTATSTVTMLRMHERKSREINWSKGDP